MAAGADPRSVERVAAPTRVAIALAAVAISAAVINAVGFGSTSVCTSAADPDCGEIARWAWVGVGVTTATTVIGLALADQRRTISVVLAFVASALTLTCAALIAAGG